MRTIFRTPLPVQSTWSASRILCRSLCRVQWDGDERRALQSDFSNIVIAGGTGAGKTTLFNMLSSFISEKERIVTIEDSAELQHDGSITTIHANTPRDGLARLETMCMMGDIRLPEKAIRLQISFAIHIIVQAARMSDGRRRITHISELTGNYSDMISMQDVFVFEKEGLGANGKVKGRFRATGIMPKFTERLKAAGIAAPASGVHTMGMMFPIDVVALDKALRVVRIWRNLRHFA